MITPSTTLAEIVSTTPALMRELERLGLDYSALPRYCPSSAPIWNRTCARKRRCCSR
jgi:hypothetical protein